MMLKVNEIFGPTIQGEGPSTGKHCVFLRLARCNLSCNFCDTPYTWATTPAKASMHRDAVIYDREIEEHEMTVNEVITSILYKWDMVDHPTMVVISGGEPMLQQKALSPVIDSLLGMGVDIEIETAGTIIPSEWWAGEVTFNCSPKLDNSGNSLFVRRKEKALAQLNELQTNFKFVVVDGNDFNEIHELINLINIDPDQVWIMPEGITQEAIIEHGRHVVNYVLSQGWNLTMRNHISLWGAERAK
jgi:7-carboxy-7-deazaguanine synthase